MVLSKMFKPLPPETNPPILNSSRETLLIPWYLMCIKQNNSKFSFLGQELMTLKLPNSSLNQEFQRNLKLAIKILISAQSSPLIVGRWTFLYISSLCFTQGSCKNRNQLFVNLMILSPSIAHHLFTNYFLPPFLCFSADMKMFKQNGRIFQVNKELCSWSVSNIFKAEWQMWLAIKSPLLFLTLKGLHRKWFLGMAEQLKWRQQGKGCGTEFSVLRVNKQQTVKPLLGADHKMIHTILSGLYEHSYI